MNLCVLLRKNQKIQLLTGQKAQDVITKELHTATSSKKKILKGVPVSPGIATGPVKIIFGVRDAQKIKKGDILVARQTTPDLLGAMKKSSAFITDEGGLLCHAAIVSRELQRPCVVGTKKATALLKDGYVVKVDADKGVITILEQ